MAEYPINKGIGRPVEFKGLKAQYLFIFCGGLLALFVLFVILYMVGIDQWICLYIQVYLWLPVSDMFSTILAKIQVLMLQNDIERMQADPNLSLIHIYRAAPASGTAQGENQRTVQETT